MASLKSWWDIGKEEFNVQQMLEYRLLKKNEFLDKIRSKTDKSKYKRAAVSPIRYAGGKSLGVGYIIEHLPANIDKVISPFFGGGSVEIAMSKYLDIEVIGYDIFDILTNYWKFQIEIPELLYKLLNKWKPDQETYDEVKNKLEDHWDRTTKTFDIWSKTCRRSKRYKTFSRNKIKIEWNEKKILKGIDLAAHYYFNFNLSYGPGFLGWASDIYLNDKKYKSILEGVRNFKPKNLKVYTSDFKDVFNIYPNDFFYCDPPYYIGAESNMFKGIYPMRNIPIHHDGFEHDVLAELLNNHKGGFILSYNDCPQIREWYKSFEYYSPVWQYTMGQGETRIGSNRKDIGSHIKKSHEILFFSPARK